MKYDFISDVHGRLNKLIQLLEKAGYIKDSEGDYYHPEGRIAFFLGDIIDKGKYVTKTFFMVKRMVEKGYAKIVLGNHELNFIAIHLKNKKGEYLRKRDEGKLRQIEKSLDLLNYKEEVFDFIYDIPLFYEEKNLKVIHACWDNKYINHVKKLAIETKYEQYAYQNNDKYEINISIQINEDIMLFIRPFKDGRYFAEICQEHGNILAFQISMNEDKIELYPIKYIVHIGHKNISEKTILLTIIPNTEHLLQQRIVNTTLYDDNNIQELLKSHKNLVYDFIHSNPEQIELDIYNSF